MGCGASAQGGKYAPTGEANQGDKPAPTNKDTEKKHAKEENKEFSKKMDFLKNVPIFKRLDPANFPLVASIAQYVTYNSGQVIIKQGDVGNEFFVIVEGEAMVSVSKDSGPSTKVATLKSGDYFGENALIHAETRTATVSASTSLTALKITQKDFREQDLQNKLAFISRKAVAGGGGQQRQLVTKTPDPKNDAEKKLISDALKNNNNLQTMVNLDEKRISAMVEVAWKEKVAQDFRLITQGDIEADYFYIVHTGNFVISQEDQNPRDSVERNVSNTVCECKTGDSFGELALLYLVPRAATVTATEDSEVWVIDRHNFKNILMKVSDAKTQEYIGFLNKVDVLQPLITDEKKALAEALVEMHFTKNEVIMQEGEQGNTFYILYDGDVDVHQNGKGVVATLKANAKAGSCQYFGERALIKHESRAATVKVVSETAKALALDRDSFNMLLGDLQTILDRAAPDGARASMVKQPGATKVETTNRERIKRRDLVQVGLLGCGGFGAVELYSHKENGNTYAMKGLSKGYIVKTGMQDSVMNEKNILMMTNSPFIIKLYECYNGAQTLYFLMEAALGGELYATYNRKGLHGSEPHAKFYCAGVVFAFEHMHERRIIYRDLKPENLLLNELGQIKLTDMGLAKFVIGKTYTTCGTPDYFAPELIASTGHTNAVDWWTLGILTFELMSGHPPFESAYPMQIYSKVMKGIAKVPFPPKCQGQVGELIKQLLKKEPAERLPMQKDGHKRLREAKWFAGKEGKGGKDAFDWTAMKELKLEPPYKPVVKSKKDIANFSARKEDMPRQIEYKDDGSGWDKDFATMENTHSKK